MLISRDVSANSFVARRAAIGERLERAAGEEAERGLRHLRRCRRRADRAGREERDAERLRDAIDAARAPAARPCGRAAVPFSTSTLGPRPSGQYALEVRDELALEVPAVAALEPDLVVVDDDPSSRPVDVVVEGLRVLHAA